jgi:hypothetical protein
MATIGVPSFADRSTLNSTGPPEPAIYPVARACHRAAPSNRPPAVRPEMPVCGFPPAPDAIPRDAQLPELTARTAQAARFDRTQYDGLGHARSGRSIHEGRGVHVFRTVAQSMNSQRCARNGYRDVYACQGGGGRDFLSATQA